MEHGPHSDEYNDSGHLDLREVWKREKVAEVDS